MSSNNIKTKCDFPTWCRQNGKEYLLDEWDYEKNEKQPTEYFPKSEQTVFWKCKKKDHSYSAPIFYRTTYNCGCYYCGGKRVLVGFNDLKTWCKENDKNRLLREWSTQDNEKGPEEYTSRSSQYIIWKCEKCGNKYGARIVDRVGKNSGCPYCHGRLPIIGKTDLFTWCKNNDREDIILDWDKVLNNGNSMENYTYASNKKVTWKCHVCSHEWTNPVHERTIRYGGCPKCSVNGTSFPEQFIYLAIRSVFKTAINRDKSMGCEIDIYIPSIKVAIEYNGTFYHRNLSKTDKLKRQICEENNIHLLQIYEIVKDFDVSGENIIGWKYSRDKKNLVDLTQGVLQWINGVFFYKIEDVNIEWDQIYKQARMDTYNVKYENSLECKSPDIAAEWDTNRNGGIKACQVSNGSHDSYFWKCNKCGLSFVMKINDRTNKKRSAGCPECGKKKQIDSWIKNRIEVKSFYDWCMEQKRQDLLDEWNIKKNIKSSQEYPSGSNQAVYWICKKCGNEWSARINNRKKSGCPVCAQMSYGIHVLQLKDGIIVAEYKSITEASEKTGISPKSIRKVLRGRQMEVKGFGWRIKE